MSNNIEWISLHWKPALITAGLVFTASLTASVILTALMARLSRRLGALDKPDGDLKCHRSATATLGGVPLFISLALGIFVSMIPAIGLGGGLYANTALAGFFVAGLIILLLGVSDDLHHVRPRVKLAIQIIASMVLLGSGLMVERCDFFGVFTLPLGVLAVPFTLFWLVGSCNAFNFIDGMDGLACGIGFISALLLGILGFMTGQFGSAVLSIGLAGGLLGVLFFNVKPASIFLGDSGSQLTGLILGALTIKICTSGGLFALPTAGLILSVPVLDALLSILRRYSKGESPIRGDRDHIHHCLRRYGLSVYRVTAVLWLTAATAGGMGLVFRFAGGVSAGLFGLGMVILQLYMGARMGCLEPGVLLSRFIGKDRFAAILDGKGSIRPSQDIAEIETLWERMKPLFEQMRLDRAVLTLEAVSDEGRTKYETYQWARSEQQMADLLGNHWTRRFSLSGDQPRIATLRLESAEQLTREQERMDWLLQQIRENMQKAGTLKQRRGDDAKITA